MTRRQPISSEDTHTIQQKCGEQDNQLGRIIALLSDRGMRIGEALGLLKSDILPDSESPYSDLKPHAWKRLGHQRSTPDTPREGIVMGG